MPVPYYLPRHVVAAVRRYGGRVERDLDAFIEAKLSNRPAPRKDKPCGIGFAGKVECQLHPDLNLWHYRLTAHADPILIYQPLPHIFQIVAVSFHEEIFQGRGLKWCHAWQEAICWDGHTDKLAALNLQFGPL